MAITHKESYDLAATTEFRERIASALATMAPAIYNEDDQTPLHTERKSLAMQIARDCVGWAETMALVVASQMASTTPEDGAISTALSATWNLFAEYEQDVV